MATVNTTNGVVRFSSYEWPLDTWIAPPSGETSRHWMDTASLLGLTSSMVESLASRIALLGAELEPTTPGTFGPPPADYLVRFDQESSSWRTSQGSLPGMESSLPSPTAFSLTLPRWVTWDAQGLSKLPTPVLLTHEPAGSAWPHWTSPTASDVYTDRLSSTQQIEGSKHSVTLAQESNRWPTPDTTEAPNNGSNKVNGPRSRGSAATSHWSTPNSALRKPPKNHPYDYQKGFSHLPNGQKHTNDLQIQAEHWVPHSHPTDSQPKSGPQSSESAPDWHLPLMDVYLLFS